MTVWDLVYNYSEPDFWICAPFGSHVTSTFVECWYHQNPGFYFHSACIQKRVIVIVGRPQQAVHAGSDDRQPPLQGFFILFC